MGTLLGYRGDVHDLAGELALVRSPDEVDEHPDRDGASGRGDSRPRGDLPGVEDDGAEDTLWPDDDRFRLPVLLGEGSEEIGVERPRPMTTASGCQFCSGK